MVKTKPAQRSRVSASREFVVSIVETKYTALAAERQQKPSFCFEKRPLHCDGAIRFLSTYLFLLPTDLLTSGEESVID